MWRVRSLTHSSHTRAEVIHSKYKDVLFGVPAILLLYHCYYWNNSSLFRSVSIDCVVRWLQLIARYAGCLFDAHSDKCSSKSGTHTHTPNTKYKYTLCDPLTYYLRSSSSTWFMWPTPHLSEKWFWNLFNTLYTVQCTLAHTQTHAYNSRKAAIRRNRWVWKKLPKGAIVHEIAAAVSVRSNGTK